MRALILGVGDAFSRRYFGSSALIEAPEGWVLLDCPDLIHRVLSEATARAGWAVGAENIDDILITHLHGDHCNGLEAFGFARWLHGNPDGRRPRIHTSRPAAARLWQRLAPAMDGSHTDSPRRLEDYFDVRTLEPGKVAKVAGLSVECRFTTHSVPTIGFLISDGRAALGWSGDSPFEREHIEWLSRADVVVHESNRGPVHTPIESLEGLPQSLKRKIRLIHLPDDFDSASTGLRALQQGEVLEI